MLRVGRANGGRPRTTAFRDTHCVPPNAVFVSGERSVQAIKSGRRRDFVKRAGGIAAAAVLPAAAHMSGSDAPEQRELRVGYVALTDCASVVMAAALGFDRKFGIRIVPSREASWASVRDKLASGALDAAHVLYGLVYGMHLGIGSPRRDMAVLMTLNNNGQGISLSRKLAERGARDGASLAALMHREPREYVLAQTFPTGTHALWLNYWLAAHGVDPLRDVTTIVVPPPQMVASMRAGDIDGFCAGEPWNHCGIAEGVSVHGASSQDIWPDHPEKVLGATRDFVARNPHAARALVMAVLEASRWIDASPGNRERTARTLAGVYVDAPVEAIVDRIQGRYQDGLGRTWTDAHPMRFHADGAVNFPYLSDGMWFMTQFKRWGLLRAHPDYLAVAGAVNQLELYREAAAQVGVSIPAEPLRSSRLIDGALWSGRDPVRYVEAQAIHA
jgi:nitrate/nitrite transport system substrate-binding protein